jgi:hypothetical protein
MKPHLVPALAIALFGSRTVKLIFLLVVLLIGFACGYGVREWISRRRRRRYLEQRRRRYGSSPGFELPHRPTTAETTPETQVERRFSRNGDPSPR